MGANPGRFKYLVIKVRNYSHNSWEYLHACQQTVIHRKPHTRTLGPCNKHNYSLALPSRSKNLPRYYTIQCDFFAWTTHPCFTSNMWSAQHPCLCRKPNAMSSDIPQRAMWSPLEEGWGRILKVLQPRPCVSSFSLPFPPRQEVHEVQSENRSLVQ